MVITKTKEWSSLGLILLASLLFVGSGSIACAMREVRVGVYDSPPLISADPHGTPVGVFADIIADVSKKEGLKLTYVYGTWEENLSWVKSGKVDLILAVGMSRGETGELSMNKLPVFFTWTQLYKAKGARWGSILDLDGKHVAGLRGDLNMSLFKRVASDIGIHPKYVEAESISHAFQLLSQRKVDAVVAERATGQYYAKEYPVEPSTLLLSPRCFGFATAKGANLDLLEMIDRLLLEEKNTPNSTYWKVLHQWGEMEPFRIPPYIPWFFGPVISLLIFSVGGNMLLKHKVRIKTRELSDRNQSLEAEIAERKRIQESLKQAKEEAETANQAKDQFIAVLSHELRTPLTPVLLSSAAMEGEEALPEGVRSELGVIRRNVELEMKLIDDLLDVTRISHGKIQLHQEVLDAHACLRNALEICRSKINEKHLNLSLRLEAEEPKVWADSARLQQVFWNLLRNAVKFTPEGGEVSIRSRNIGGRLRMEFSDTGVGIDPAVLPRIFNAFEQAEQSKMRHFGGLGLGLSIAKAVVELHHGTLTAFSEGNDKGATFTLELATVPEVKAPPVSPGAPPLSQSGSKTILLVEDNVDTLRILAKMLQKWGYTVRTAESVQSALEEAAKEPFDLLVSDIGLPDGSGLEIMQQTQKLYGVSGIAISGFGTEEDISQSREAGFREHLVKPVSIQDLHAAVQRIASEPA